MNKNTKIQTIDILTLKEIVSNITHSTPLSLISVTDARAKIRNNPFGPILKWVKVNAFAGTNYQNAVRRQEKREMPEVPATFISQERKWGDSVEGSPALLTNISKTGELSYYLIVQIQRVTKPIYLVKKGEILTAIPKEEVEQFLPIVREDTNQPVEKTIIWKTYALTSLMGLAINGEKYRIRNNIIVPTFIPDKVKTKEKIKELVLEQTKP